MVKNRGQEEIDFKEALRQAAVGRLVSALNEMNRVDDTAAGRLDLVRDGIEKSSVLPKRQKEELVRKLGSIIQSLGK